MLFLHGFSFVLYYCAKLYIICAFEFIANILGNYEFAMSGKQIWNVWKGVQLSHYVPSPCLSWTPILLWHITMIVMRNMVSCIC